MAEKVEIPYVNVREIREKGDAIYERLKDDLEAEHWGEIIVIEPESEDYFIGKDTKEAHRKARGKYPDKVFRTLRIGPRAVYRVPWGRDGR
jgi:hypothetical protein